MPAPALRRGALLLPLSLALCGDSLNVRACNPHPKDTTIRVPVACTLVLSGALTGEIPCAGTWEQQPGHWAVKLGGAAPGGPSVSVWVGINEPPQVGLAYRFDAPSAAILDGSIKAAGSGAQGYEAHDGNGTAWSVLGTGALTFAGVAPVAGTIEATLLPGGVNFTVPGQPTTDATPGPAGTSVTVVATFQEP
jgi:hypothetical protein